MRLLPLFLFSLLSSSVAAAPQTLTVMEGNPPAPEFTLKDLEGKSHRLADLRGKTVIVNFWATWCPPCREEMPSMQRAYERLKPQGVEMVAIDVGEDADTVFRFTADYQIEFPLLLDLDSKVIGAWPVKGLPSTFVVDPQGRIAYRAIGGRAWDDPALLAPVLLLQKQAGVAGPAQ